MIQYNKNIKCSILLVDILVNVIDNIYYVSDEYYRLEHRLKGSEYSEINILFQLVYFTYKNRIL
jgi:hypothetical protein